QQGPVPSAPGRAEDGLQALEDRAGSQLALFTLGARLGERDSDLLACNFQRLRCGVWFNLNGGFAGLSRAGYALAALIVQAHVEFQRPGLLAAGRGADAGDL